MKDSANKASPGTKAGLDKKPAPLAVGPKTVVANAVAPKPAPAPKSIIEAQAGPSPVVAAAPVISPEPVLDPVASIETPQPAAAPVAPARTEGTITMTDTITQATDTAKNFAADAQAKSQAVFGDMSERAKSSMEKSSKMISELNEFGKGNIEAIVESSKVAAKAAETIGQQVAETARKNFESATAAMKSFASVKTPTEFFQLQSDYARSAFDSLIADTSKNSEAMLKIAGEVMQPISNRLAVAAEKIKIAA